MRDRDLLILNWPRVGKVIKELVLSFTEEISAVYIF